MMDLMVELESAINTIQSSDKPNHLQAFVEALLGDASNPTLPHSTAELFHYPQSLPPFSPSSNVWFEPHPLPSLFPPTVLPEPWSFPHPAPPPPPSAPHEPQVGQMHMSTLPLPDNVLENMVPVGTVNGEVVYGLPPMTFPAVLSSVPAPPKRSHKKRQRQQDNEQPYVKKPPNAFMLFLKKQRSNVVAELNLTNNADINTELGQRWRSMSPLEKDQYFNEAEELRRLHEQQFPRWSTRDNYGKKRKRVRRNGLMVPKDQ